MTVVTLGTDSIQHDRVGSSVAHLTTLGDEMFPFSLFTENTICFTLRMSLGKCRMRSKYYTKDLNLCVLKKHC